MTEKVAINGQKIIEKILCMWAFCIGLAHMLLATFQYVVNYREYINYIRWAGLGLLIVAIIYLIGSLVLSKATCVRTLIFLKKALTFEQVLLIGLLCWFFVSLWVNQIHGDYLYIRMHDWWLFDTAVSVFILFPMAKAVGIEKAKKALDVIIHVVVISYTVFTVVCVWHIFHLEVLTFPSGEQAGMTEGYQLMLGKHYNLTGMISATLFCLCIYMVVNHELCIRVIYGICGIVHLLVIYLSNSRTVFVGVLAFIGCASFFLAWNYLRGKRFPKRILFSVLLCICVCLLYWFGRNGAFASFERITHFSEEIRAEANNLCSSGKTYYPTMLTNKTSSSQYVIRFLAAPGEESVRQVADGLSLRQYVWRAAIKLLGTDSQITLFGVTPVEVTDSIRDIGGYWSDVAHAHNAILQAGVGFGVPAMGLFLAFLCTIGFNALQVLKTKKGSDDFNNKIVFAAGILCFVTVNMAETYIVAYFSIMSSVFFLFCGFISTSRDKEKKYESNRLKKFSKPIIAIAVTACVLTTVLYYSLNYLNLNRKYINGSGTSTDPYRIENIDDLKYFRDLVNKGNRFNNCYFLQTDNIDLLNEEWVPIGLINPHYEFSGIYDGDCHYIENLKISEDYPYSPAHVGFFGMLSGTVLDLGIESGSIKGETVGGIARFGSAGSLILNCYNKADLTGTIRAGGICDNMKAGGSVVNCVNIGYLDAPRTGNLVSFDAAFVAGVDRNKDVSDLFTGIFMALPLKGEGVEDILNSGIAYLEGSALLDSNRVRMWD